MSLRNAVVQLNIFQHLLCKILKNHDELTKRVKQNESTKGIELLKRSKLKRF